LNKAPRILVAEDDEDDRELFKLALRNRCIDANVSFCSDGEQLLALIGAEEKPELIFLDINMPRINGIECLQRIRQHYSPEQVAVVMVSTSTARKTVEHCQKLGATAYICKPSHLEHLEELLFFCVTQLGIAKSVLPRFFLNEIVDRPLNKGC
jgi:CheY-like chemotaxis protein